jgi:integral membrane protein
VSRTLRAYQVVATLVGLNLIFVITAAVAQRVTDDFSWWNRNDGLIFTIDQVHGLLFMLLLVLIAMLHTRERWNPWFTITTMLLATIPLVSFWAERRTTRTVRAAHHEAV